MAVRSTGSTSILLAIRDTLTGISASQAKDSTMSEASGKLDEIIHEVKRTRVGHELHTWGQEVELDEEAD